MRGIFVDLNKSVQWPRLLAHRLFLLINSLVCLLNASRLGSFLFQSRLLATLGNPGEDPLKWKDGRMRGILPRLESRWPRLLCSGDNSPIRLSLSLWMFGSFHTSTKDIHYNSRFKMYLWWTLSLESLMCRVLRLEMHHWDHQTSFHGASCSSQVASQRPYDHLPPNRLDSRTIVTLLLSFLSAMYSVENQRLVTYTIAGSCRVAKEQFGLVWLRHDRRSELLGWSSDSVGHTSTCRNGEWPVPYQRSILDEENSCPAFRSDFHR